jgi:hypothetical protein
MTKKSQTEEWNQTFGAPGVIQKRLDAGLCPKCLVKLPEPADNGSVTCINCLLTIGDYVALPKM